MLVLRFCVTELGMEGQFAAAPVQFQDFVTQFLVDKEKLGT